MLKRLVAVAAFASMMLSVCALADVVDDKAKFDTALAFEVTQASSEAFELDTPEPLLATNASIDFERRSDDQSAFMTTKDNFKTANAFQVDAQSSNPPSEVGWRIYQAR